MPPDIDSKYEVLEVEAFGASTPLGRSAFGDADAGDGSAFLMGISRVFDPAEAGSPFGFELTGVYEVVGTEAVLPADIDSRYERLDEAPVPPPPVFAEGFGLYGE